MLSKKMIAILQKQIDMEGNASQKYLAMALWADSNALEHTAKFYYRQAEEETEHMMKIVHYMLENNASPKVPDIKSPKHSYKSIKDSIEVAYKNECAVTKAINSIVDLSIKESDHRTNNFMQWYISEQMEEEALFVKIMDKIELIGSSTRSTYYIDRAIGRLNVEIEAAEAGEEK